MALKKALVIGTSGQIQQLQPGDSIAAPTTIQQTNGEGSAALVAGTPVYHSAADTVKRAQANASGTSRVSMITVDASIASSASGNFVTAGNVLSATVAQWAAVGDSSMSAGLTFGQVYFLDPANPGKLTATPPTATGQYLVEVGEGLSTTELLFDPKAPIQL